MFFYPISNISIPISIFNTSLVIIKPILITVRYSKKYLYLQPVDNINKIWHKFWNRDRGQLKFSILAQLVKELYTKEYNLT